MNSHRRLSLAVLAAALAACAPASLADDNGAPDALTAPTETVPGGGRGPASASEDAAAPPTEGGLDPVRCNVNGDAFDTTALSAGVGYLASEQLAGRVPGTAGDVAARAFVEGRFRCLGLTPGGKNGSYQLPFVNAGGAATANVVGYIRGTDPSVGSDIIVVGAHHDHFGTGGGLGLRLGANDNASGVVGMLAVAQAMKKKGTPPRRTIAFVAFGSEETATEAPFVEGSAAYVANAPPDLPLAKVVYMINFDMIGSYSQEQKVYAIGSMAKTPASTMLPGIVSAAAGLSVSLGEPGEEGDSDFYPFCIARIPYVFFWTSDDACYHKSCDLPNRVDYPHMAQIARVGADLTGNLADSTVDLAGWRKTAKVAQLGCTD